MSIDHQELEEGSKLSLDFDKLKKSADCGQPVLPAVVQDIDSKEVLIAAYVQMLAIQ